ncbi:glycosyltransferase [Haliscomenobacter sp.]|uniref:glycosyltransferase n=1 Tax=Haliscomenobacter sp. TaxID=2717303 RepID=UPI003593B598
MSAVKTLVTPLDWGLGHATRSVPLIQKQLEQGHEVHLASSGRALAFLKVTFPDLPCHQLPDYAISYPKANLYWPMVRQLPKIIVTIAREQRVVRQLQQKIGFQQVISDQRYGCYIPGAFNAFVTHQLHLPLQDWFGGSGGQWMHETLIRKRFQECWVPDWEEAPGLAGDLSHPPFTGIKTRYLGPLSRLHKMEAPIQYRIAFVLSGPEPQRSIWEAEIREQVRAFPEEHFFLLQGKPEVPFFQEQEGNLTAAPHLDTAGLSLLFAQSGLIVCRSGYSTLMDLAVTGRPAWLVPTPGQPEQEYLARKLGAEGQFPWSKQEDFELAKCLNGL